MRLSPQTIFAGLVVLGLPISVLIGWSVAVPIPAPIPAGEPTSAFGTGGLGSGGAAGGFGEAPRRAGTVRPTTTAPHSSAPTITSASATPATTAIVDSPPPSGDSISPSAEVSLSAEPSLTEPPVPTPTEVGGSPSRPALSGSTAAS